MRVFTPLFLSLVLSACFADETVRGYGGADMTWRLVELNGKKFNATVTLTFPEKGRIAGQGPCNGYSGSMTAPYPWFKTGPIAATKRACPDLAAESVFFNALGKATLSEVFDGTLMLSTEEGTLMVFKSGG